MRVRRTWTASVMAAAALGLLAAGCASEESGSGGTSNPSTVGGTFRTALTKDDTTPPKQGGKLVYGLSAETDGWNPSGNRWASSGYIVGFSLMDPLAAYDENLEPKPYLAEAFTHNEDFTLWTIKLRQGVTFHDGAPVDAAAVKRNLEAHKASALTADTMAFLQTITVVDPLTVEVKMSQPWSTFPHLLTAQPGAVMAPSMIDAGSDGNRKPVGSGPFILDNWEPGKRMTLKRNPNYWRKDANGTQLPYLANLEFSILGDVQSRGAALENGGVNMFETWDPQQIIKFTDLAKDGRYQIFTDQKGDGSKIFVALNVTKEPFDDPIARQAVAYAADTTQLSELGFAGIFPPAQGIFSENSPYYADLGDKRPSYNPDKARQLAQEYQAKHGKPIEFSANIIPTPEISQVAQILQQQAEAVGIKVDIQSMEQSKLIVDAITGNYQATGFILFGSPHIDREYAFIASPAKPNNQFSLNFTRIGLNADGSANQDNAKIVTAMNEARKTVDREKQKEQYAIVQEEMAKNNNFIFLVRQTTAVVMDNNVRGALNWTLPDGSKGQATTSTFTFNLSLTS